MKWLKYLLMIFLISCVQDPIGPKKMIYHETAKDGAFVLCEGIWGQGNSSLARYDRKSGNLIADYFNRSNPAMALGDLANDIVLFGDTAFVAVTSAKVIEVFHVETGESIGRIRLPENSAPREIAIMNDSTAFISDLYLDILHIFNPKTLELAEKTIPTGPAPEGIAVYQDLIFAANSGYGYYRRKEAKAGTVSVIDANSGKEIALLDDMPNAIELLINEKKQRLYCCYYHITAEFDSVGGIVEYNLNTLSETRRWEIDAMSIEFTSTKDTLIFIANNDIYLLDITSDQPPLLLIANPKPAEIWYALAVSPLDNALWVCNAKNHQINGELAIYDNLSAKKATRFFLIGVNPSKIVFF